MGHSLSPQSSSQTPSTFITINLCFFFFSSRKKGREKEEHLDIFINKNRVFLSPFIHNGLAVSITYNKHRIFGSYIEEFEENIFV